MTPVSGGGGGGSTLDLLGFENVHDGGVIETPTTKLDVLSILTNRNNATIYDLTTYDADRLSAIGRLLDAQ